MDLFLPQWSKLQSCPPFVAEDKENLHAWVIGKSFQINKAARRRNVLYTGQVNL